MGSIESNDVLCLSGLQTEAANGRTSHIDQVSTLQMCSIINDEDRTVAASITPCLPDIAGAIDSLLPRVRRGGRVIYIGAGTSGRLGILDSSEIPPTFAAPPSQFVGIIAGGDAAIRQAQEGAEDDPDAGKRDLTALDLDTASDSVIGIAASGRTPYVLGALEYAKSIGCLTIGVACVLPSEMGESGHVDFMISPLPGPEVVTGSTRLKAGTATKLVLNMLSTGTMIKAGKTHENMMVDLMASNRKLKQRSLNILRKLSRRCDSMTDVSLDNLLARCDGSVKLALVVAETDLPVSESRQRLQEAGGVLVRALAPKSKTCSGRSLANGSKREGLILCVDGGGSKCAAMVTTSSGIIGRGVGGPCNLADGDLQSGIDSIITAAQRALKSLDDIVNSSSGTNKPPRTLERGLFSSVWIATAGMDRVGLRERLIPALSVRLQLDESANVRLTSDADLLAAIMTRHPDVPSSLVVVAGTGSIAMRYSCNNNEVQATPTRIARSGGWGHLLGDEGAGYAIGRQATRQVLSSLEDMKLGRGKPTLSQMEREIVSFFNGSPRLEDDNEDREFDLLSKVLMASDERSTKARIARVAQIALTAHASGDSQAKDIISREVLHLVDNTLSRLIDPRSHGYVDPSHNGLILSGSVMLHDAYLTIFHRVLAERGIQFAYVETVPDPALVGAEYLLSTIESNGLVEGAEHRDSITKGD